MSLSFSANLGSFESLNVRMRWGVKRHPELTPRRHEELTPHVASVRM